MIIHDSDSNRRTTRIRWQWHYNLWFYGQLSWWGQSENYRCQIALVHGILCSNAWQRSRLKKHCQLVCSDCIYSWNQFNRNLWCARINIDCYLQLDSLEQKGYPCLFLALEYTMPSMIFLWQHFFLKMVFSLNIGSIFGFFFFFSSNTTITEHTGWIT